MAKHYGVSDVALHKVCKRLNIPVLPRGYWARLRAGEKVKKTPLPPHKGPNVIYGKHLQNSRHSVERTEDGKKVLLAFLDETERQKRMDTCASEEWTAFHGQVMTEYRRFRSLMEEIRAAGIG